MRLDPISRRYGRGAAHIRVSAVPLAAVPAPAPLAGSGQAAATVVVGGLALFGLFRALNPDAPTESELQIVPLVAEVIPPEPPPPEPEPEPEPIVVAEPEPPPPPKPEPKPEPVVVAKAEPPKPKPKPVMPKPEALAAPAPKLEEKLPPPPKPAPPTPARRPVPVVKFDAPKPIAEPVEDTRTQWRPVAVEKKPAPAAPKMPKLGIAAVGGPAVEAPPEPPTRVASLPPGMAGPKVRPPGPPKFAPPAALAAAVPSDNAPPPPAARAAAPSPLPTAMNGANHALASKKVAFAGAATDTSAGTATRGTGAPTRERVAEAPLPSAPGRAEPNQKLRGVPLSSMAACRSDQREDALKLQVIAAVRNRKECSSDAGTYRFVETKNLNAFLLWIERAPGRPAVDRCGELGFALTCLKQ